MLSAMNAKQQREYVDWVSVRMATSGQYRDWREIELKLRSLGVYEAPRALRGEYTRRWLNRLCNEARRRYA